MRKISQFLCLTRTANITFDGKLTLFVLYRVIQKDGLTS